MDTSIFDGLYKQLNKEQKIAVDSIEGAVMVIAGPGTGKTRVLTLRIANILRLTDTNPENILALTFTEASALNMRERLRDIIGSPAYRVCITTFHSFCNDIIISNPEAFPHIVSSKNISEVERIGVVEDVVKSLSLDILKPFGNPVHYVRAIISALGELKREGVSVSDFDDFVMRIEKEFSIRDDKHHKSGVHKGKMKGEFQRLERQILKHRELFQVYKSYQEFLKERGLYDYEDMIMETASALGASEELLFDLQERYQFVLVDEHQDTNSAQNKVLELLCSFHKNPNIFVVGDKKQAIFRFQGASLENFLYFGKIYPDALCVTLRKNYRSTKIILDSVHSIFSDEVSLVSAGFSVSSEEVSLGEVVVREFSNSYNECHFLANDIRDALERGVQPSEIAVLYRDNKDSVPVSKALDQVGVLHAVESDRSVLDDYDIKKLIILMRVVDSFGVDENLVGALHIDFLGIEPLDIYTLLQFAEDKNRSLYSVIKSAMSVDNLVLHNPDRICEVYKMISKWKIMASNTDISTLFENMVRESGFLTYITKLSDAPEKLAKLCGLHNEIRALSEQNDSYTLRDFIQYLDMLNTHSIMIRPRGGRGVSGRVRLMTAHRAKGLEFQEVYIVGCYDGHWGGRRRSNLITLFPDIYSRVKSDISNGNNIDDERRLFYVAVTRAKERVSILYAKEGVDGRAQLPSQFISEMNSGRINFVDESSDKNSVGVVSGIRFGGRVLSGGGIKDVEFVSDLFRERGFSVTALNNYLTCPWRYFYINLLRIPRAKTIHQVYGTAVHSALRDFFDCSLKMSKKSLIGLFSKYIRKETFFSGNFDVVLKRGGLSLGGWYDVKKVRGWKKPILVEFSIRGVLLEDVRLTGILDKVEVVDGSSVNVVDYKTGKPKSRNFIEGKTKNSNGDIRRQLTFYRLLLDRYDGGKYSMQSGEIDFVEPDSRGNYKTEIFDISTSEVSELEELIVNVADEIVNLKFWSRLCDDMKCEFCELRRLME